MPTLRELQSPTVGQGHARERKALVMDFKELETNKEGDAAWNYMQATLKNMPEALKRYALEPALVGGARAVASAIRTAYVARVGRKRVRIPEKLRKYYRRSKFKGELYKSIKAQKGYRRYTPSSVLRVGGPGARQAFAVEEGHKGAFVHGVYDKNARVPGKGFVRAGLASARNKQAQAVIKTLQRHEERLVQKTKELARVEREIGYY